jgi:hypothetical protein
MPKIIEKVLENGKFDPDQLGLRLRDIAARDPQLEIFREKEILLEFLQTGKHLLRSQLNLSDDEISTLIRHVEQTYEQFMDETIAAAALFSQFERLGEYFCRPPDGPGGQLVGPTPEHGGPGGASSERVETVCNYVNTFSTLGSFLWAVIEKIFLSGPSASAKQTSLPYEYQILALVSISGFVEGLASSGELQAKVKAGQVAMA